MYGYLIDMDGVLYRGSEMIAGADRVLKEQCELIAIGVRSSIAKILNVITRHLVRVGAQWRKRQSSYLRNKGERIHLDVVIDVFAAEKAGEIIIGAREAHVAAELDGVQVRRETQGVGDIQAMLASAPGKDG